MSRSTEQIFLSIIIPSYNRAEFLNRTLHSVVSQLTDQVEVIVIDDGSSPPSDSVVSTFNDERIKYIFQKNQGRGSARNKGIELAAGKYLHFLDDDDLLCPDFLANVIECDLKESVLVFSYEMIKHGEKEGRVYTSKGNSNFLKKYVLDSYALSGFLFNKEALGDIRFQEGAFIGEDFSFIFKTLQKLEVQHVDKLIVQVQLHDSQTTSKKYKVNKEKVYPELKTNILDLLVRNRIDIPFSTQELDKYINTRLNEMIKGLAMEDLEYAKLTLSQIKADYPQYVPITNLRLAAFNLRGKLKRLIGS